MAYAFWNRAVSALGPTAINTLIYFIPLIGVISGIHFLGEPLTPALFWGGGLIFCGVLLARWR
jgi:drug/metabolite transporter (DMT)-like permease